MNPAREIRPFHHFPDPDHHDNLQRLERDITELAAHINAASYQLLELVGIYDEQQGWGQHGLASCAHWLQWQCGTNLSAAREKVRVARALPDLPKISAAFREGRVSYSKVRAMTRVATPRNEDTLLNVALHGTAHHVEKMVRNYRRGKRLEALDEENRRHALRELSWYVDGDGCWVFRGCFSPEQGALIAKALEKAMDQQFEERREEHPDVSAETPKGGITEWEEPQPIATRRADALERLAESFLADGEKTSAGGDRYLVHIHTGAEVLQADGEGAESECEDGCHLSAETSRRVACDAAVVHWRENADGEPLNIGRKSRTIPPAIRRALQRRDGGCRFPGCSCRRFVDAHHIVHWADGGETRMENLVLLCRRHHRLVHEGGFGVHRAPGNEIRFSYPGGDSLPVTADGRYRGNVTRIKVQNREKGLDIGAKTLPPRWRGEVMDYDHAQFLLQQRE
ncbi:MAG: DUF222 domain-containing protein [Xanthomonadales bacterium]|nr:DUF222 domain-containing protein [Xanthomonadales bacterium]